MEMALNKFCKKTAVFYCSISKPYGYVKHLYFVYVKLLYIKHIDLI